MKIKTLFILISVMLGFGGILRVRHHYILSAFPIVYSLFLMIYNVWMRRCIRSRFDSSMTLIFVGMFASVFSSVYYEHTSVPQVLFAYIPYYMLFIYYLLIQKDVKVIVVEKTLVYLSIFVCVFYILQFLLYQQGESIIHVSDDFNWDKGTTIRFRLNGSILTSFAIFYGLNRFWTEKKKMYILLVALGICVQLLMAFRTLVVVTFLTSVILCALVNGFKSTVFKYLLIAYLGAMSLYNIPIVQEKVDFMLYKQTSGNDDFSNSDYVRWANLEYHRHSFFQSDIERFFGTGWELGTTQFAKKMDLLTECHFHYSDWGLYGLSWVLGIITIVGIYLFVIKVLLYRYNKEHLYLWAIYFYLLLSSITTSEFYRVGNFAIHALFLYLINNYAIERKHNKTYKYKM